MQSAGCPANACPVSACSPLATAAGRVQASAGQPGSRGRLQGCAGGCLVVRMAGDAGVVEDEQPFRPVPGGQPGDVICQYVRGGQGYLPWASCVSYGLLMWIPVGVYKEMIRATFRTRPASPAGRRSPPRWPETPARRAGRRWVQRGRDMHVGVGVDAAGDGACLYNGHAIPFLRLRGWHAPAGRRACEPRPLAQDGQIGTAPPVGVT